MCFSFVLVRGSFAWMLPGSPLWCCIGFSTDLFKVGWLVYRCPQVTLYHGYNFGDGTQKVGLDQRSVGTCSFYRPVFAYHS